MRQIKSNLASLSYLAAAPTFVLILLLGFAFQNCSEPRLNTPDQPPKSVSIVLKNYCPPTGSNFKEVFAANHSSSLIENQFLPDWDRDGLADQTEADENLKQQYGVSLSTMYTETVNPNTAYFSDLVKIRLGFDVDNQFRFAPCDSNYNDYDLDGLSDCEEEAIKTDPLYPDSDGDGIPDGIEVRNYMNPSDVADAQLDPDQDGNTNLVEVKRNTPLKQSANQYTAALAIAYDVETYPQGNGDNCYDVYVDNIPIMNVTNGNYVRIVLTETKTEVSGTETVEILELQQVNVIIDRNVLAESLIEVNKDNTSRSQQEIVNLVGVQ